MTDQTESTALSRLELYCAGVFEGYAVFGEGGPTFAYVDQKSRFLGTPQKPIHSGDWLGLPFDKLFGKRGEYNGADWSGETVTLPCGDVYSRHVLIDGMVGGEPMSGQVWAQRKADPAIDIVTAAGRVVAFIYTHRYGMEIAVEKGFEPLTPLAQYEDPALKLSRPVYGVDCMGISTSTMRDGVKLAQRVFLPYPRADGQKFPTILVRSCYTKERMQFKLSKYVNKGYALVTQDVRGRGDSEGELDPFYQERGDSADTIDWIIRQDWSDGGVGTWGASYLGHTVAQGAASGHPNLLCVVNEVNVGSPFYDTVRRGGALCSEPLLCWALAQSAGQRPDMRYMSGEVDWPAILAKRPIKDIARQVLGSVHNDLWAKWTAHDEEDEWWQRSSLTRHFDKVRAPMLVVSGWYDGDGLGVSETWRNLTRHDVPGRRLILGPWAHNPNTFRDIGDVPLGDNAIVYNFDITNLRWYDHYMKGVDNGVDREPRATYYVVNENQWHTSGEWNPAEGETVPLYLGGVRANSVNGAGALSWSNPADEAGDTYRYDPEIPHSAPKSELDGRTPINYKGHELRNDMLVYTSEPLPENLTIAGEISARFHASSSARDTDWLIRLLDVDESGNARQLSQNLIRAKFRGGWDRIDLLEPGRIERYTLLMESNGWRVNAGHRLRVHIQSSLKELVFPNPNTGEPPFDETTSVPADNTIWHGGRYASFINLPVIR
ncbi:MAG: CocE/NonD family hydrolase [Oscillospiraceae bacterium]|jgi:putative CocE/NonD family hydrolase|nr:CocE/NonD family hydrolase [Oscillospiraceae bacterium]